jgi:large subunit ribosomal protein L10Ae
MSKVNSEILENAVRDILAYSNGEKIVHNGEERTGKKRKFTESVELQITIKNFDPTKDKRFSGTYRLPLPPKSSMKICVIANAKHVEMCQKAGDDGLPFITQDQLKALKKKKAELKKIANKYDAFMASDTLIKRVPRLLPGLNRKGKFPTRVPSADDPLDYVDEVRSTIKYQMKKVLCLNLAVGNVTMR